MKISGIASPYHPEQLSDIIGHYFSLNNDICLFLQAVLLLSKLPSEIVGKKIDEQQLYNAVNVILSLQVTVVNVP